MQPIEKWRAVPGWVGYEVSDFGRVRSIDRKVGNRTFHGTLIANSNRGDGRKQVNLSAGGRKTTFMTHRLVLMAFVGPCPADMEACHNNGDHSDNRLVNLRWDTKKANAADKVLHGTVYQLNLTECRRGHSYTPENIYRFPNGKRTCRTCMRERPARAERLERAIG